MSGQNDQFDVLMKRLRDGSQAAARELLEFYGDHVYRAVRRRLNRQMRAKFDSQDFVQAVWASFFADLNVISNFDRPESLIAFLARVASNKVIDECRRRMKAQKRDIERDQPIEDSEFGTQSSSLAAEQPTASEVAIAKEQWSRLVDGQPTHYRKILELRAEGSTYNEIAQSLGVNEKTVRRVIIRLSERLM